MFNFLFFMISTLLCLIPTGIIWASQSPQAYLNKTAHMQRVLVIGGGLAYRYKHPENHYLINNSPDHRPHYIADITKTGSLPADFNNQFDVVVWEYVDVQHFVKKETLTRFCAPNYLSQSNIEA